MKKTIFVGLFIFSLVLNFAVAATLGWQVWKEGSFRGAPQPPGAEVSNEDFRQIRKAMSAQNGSALMETRQQIMQKNAELLDLVARNPGDLNAAEVKIRELAALKEQMERRAIARISTVMASLPEEKRQAFLAFLKKQVLHDAWNEGAAEAAGAAPGKEAWDLVPLPRLNNLCRFVCRKEESGRTSCKSSSPILLVCISMRLASASVLCRRSSRLLQSDDFCRRRR